MKKILFATSEAVPFIKTGGLADVAGSLPKFFDKEKYDVRGGHSMSGFWRQSMKESPFILSIMNFILMVLHHMERCIQMLRSFHFSQRQY